jgi:hypothetical protein
MVLSASLTSARRSMPLAGTFCEINEPLNRIGAAGLQHATPATGTIMVLVCMPACPRWQCWRR